MKAKALNLIGGVVSAVVIVTVGVALAAPASAESSGQNATEHYIGKVVSWDALQRDNEWAQRNGYAPFYLVSMKCREIYGPVGGTAVFDCYMKTGTSGEAYGQWLSATLHIGADRAKAATDDWYRYYPLTNAKRIQTPYIGRGATGA
jgi:hypothetical protein